jgi:apolipoprotein N-acyltransferase
MVLGAMTALGLPPLSQLWATVLALSLLLVMETRHPARKFAQSLLRGLAFGFGYFCVALHWIGYAFLVDAATYLWMMPFAVGGLALFMAIYWGLGFLLTEWLVHKGFIRWITLACVLSLMEMLRGHLLTGFPWAAPGLMADASLEILQAASLVGMPGLTLLILLWAMAPAALWLMPSQRMLAVIVLLSSPPRGGGVSCAVLKRSHPTFPAPSCDLSNPTSRKATSGAKRMQRPPSKPC